MWKSRTIFLLEPFSRGNFDFSESGEWGCTLQINEPQLQRSKHQRATHQQHICWTSEHSNHNMIYTSTQSWCIEPLICRAFGTASVLWTSTTHGWSREPLMCSTLMFGTLKLGLIDLQSAPQSGRTCLLRPGKRVFEDNFPCKIEGNAPPRLKLKSAYCSNYSLVFWFFSLTSLSACTVYSNACNCTQGVVVP